MARAGTGAPVPQMPSPNERSDTLSEAGEGLESGGSTDGRAHEGTYYQMAFLFLQDGSVVTGRINWPEYWKMQQDMANLIGCHRDILVAIFHVEHPPRDIEEMDAQVVLPVRALRDAAKDILQELAGHAREDEDDPSMMQRPLEREDAPTPSSVQTHTLHVFA